MRWHYLKHPTMRLLKRWWLLRVGLMSGRVVGMPTTTLSMSVLGIEARRERDFIFRRGHARLPLMLLNHYHILKRDGPLLAFAVGRERAYDAAACCVYLFER
jgi:hypothetical protein